MIMSGSVTPSWILARTVNNAHLGAFSKPSDDRLIPQRFIYTTRVSRHIFRFRCRNKSDSRINLVHISLQPASSSAVGWFPNSFNEDKNKNIYNSQTALPFIGLCLGLICDNWTPSIFPVPIRCNMHGKNQIIASSQRFVVRFRGEFQLPLLFSNFCAPSLCD